jgi:phosphomannomutase/phosphoglucomutase
MSLKINPSVFREYDIRGTVNDDLSEDFAYNLGRAYAQMVKENSLDKVIVGYDCRHSSKPYAAALARGISEEGISVLVSGMGPTPQVYFAIFSQNAGGGIQVTGSHNPPDMNGFKICLGKETLSGPQIQQIKDRMISLSDSVEAVTRGTITEKDLSNEYCDYLIEQSKNFLGRRKPKIVIDAGNGTGGIPGAKVLKALGADVVELFTEPDGDFPNHHPDPSVPENMTFLMAAVQKEKADIGIAWDGDADRIGVVDERGSIIHGDMLLLIYARWLLKEVPGATIIGDVKCSELLFEDIRARGGNAIMWKTGHSLIKKKLKEVKGHIAGEMSGHMFFGHRYLGFDDGIHAAARLLEIISHSDLPFSQILSDLKSVVSTPEIRIDCREEEKFALIKKAGELFLDYPVDTTDGIRIKFEKGWGLLRASNTQAVIVSRYEAETLEDLEKYRTIVEERLEEARSLLP